MSLRKKTIAYKKLTGCVELVFSACAGSEESRRGKKAPTTNNSLRFKVTPNRSEPALAFSPAVANTIGVRAENLIVSDALI
jgi:hypothetical protein